MLLSRFMFSRSEEALALEESTFLWYFSVAELHVPVRVCYSVDCLLAMVLFIVEKLG